MRNTFSLSSCVLCSSCPGHQFDVPRLMYSQKWEKKRNESHLQQTQMSFRVLDLERYVLILWKATFFGHAVNRVWGLRKQQQFQNFPVFSFSPGKERKSFRRSQTTNWIPWDFFFLSCPHHNSAAPKKPWDVCTVLLVEKKNSSRLQIEGSFRLKILHKRKKSVRVAAAMLQSSRLRCP